MEVGYLLPCDGADSESFRPGGAMRALFQRLRWLFQRSSREAELREELQYHLDEEAAQRQDDGTAGDAARYASQRELGNVALVAEDTRAAWGWTQLEHL